MESVSPVTVAICRRVRPGCEAAGRDPQLAVLYALVALTLGVWGGGRYLLDFWRNRHADRTR